MIRILLSFIIGLTTATTHATTFNLVDENTRVVGHNLIVYTHKDDTLLDIARQFDIGYREIASANQNLDVWLPGENQRVLVPNKFILPDAPHKGIVINLAEMRLYYYPKTKAGQVQQVITHPIGIGRQGWTTPIGKGRIIQKKKDPTWTPPASILAEHLEKGDPLPKVVPAGPDNPLGAYAMRLSLPGYLLHGTNRPFGVGMRVSHGCIRLFPEDIEHLFGIVPVDTSVEILYQPYKAALEGDVLHLEVHEIQEDMDIREGNNMTPMVAAILKAQNEILSDEEWPTAEKLVREHSGVVVTVNKGEVDVVDNVWFIHAGLTLDVKSKLKKALTSLELTDYFWPIPDAAEGEILIGPFDSQDKADKVAIEVNRLTDISVWSVVVSEEDF